ncbi:OmpP1/FadL family transporter [Thalassoglobus sp.]|uniref:OmpP1/FadL family transporter n=1 Tax=Thalassoglobus sp. TaxID=2795869 RepID=UPI003AA806C0
MSRHKYLLVTLLIFSASSQVQADGLFLNGVSPRSIGRGGTNIGHSDNGAILFDNPAAMTNIKGHWLNEVGVDILITDFEYQDEQNTRTASSSIGTPLPQISMIRKSADGHWAYGFGVFTPAGFSESYRMNGSFPFLGPQSYDSFGSLTKILPGLAYAPNDRFSFGGTLGVGVSHVEVESPYFLQSPGPLQGTPTLLDLQGTGATLIWSAGMQYKLSEATTFGLTYQSESDFKLDGRAHVAIPTMGSSRYDADIKIKWPRSLGVGVKHQLTRRGTFSADVIWFDWSSAFKDLNIALNGPETPGYPEVNETLPLDWSDTVSIRLGHEIDLGRCQTLRFGYVYHRNPIPRTTITPLIQAITEHGLSTGYGFVFHGVEIDLAYMLTIGKDVHVTNSQLVGGDFNNARHGAVTHAISVGAIKRF